MTHRRCKCGLNWVLAQLAVALALQPHLSSGQANSTLAADIDALVEFAYEFQPVEGTLLATWGSSSDPCNGDGWPGVLCQCSDLPTIAAAGCSDTPDPSGSLRVKGLDLHQMDSGMQQLQGPVPTALGSLDQLVYIDLSSNQLRLAHKCPRISFPGRRCRTAVNHGSERHRPRVDRATIISEFAACVRQHQLS